MQNYEIEPKEGFRESIRYEIHDGKIHNMAGASTIHNEITGNIFNIFKNFLKGKKCRLFGENENVIFKKHFRRFLPDIKIVCSPDKIKKDGIHGAPDLIAEVLSPGTELNDLGYKKDVYEENGVKEYWIISPEAKSIVVYLLESGKYKIDNVYRALKDYEYEELTEEQKKRFKFEFKLSLGGFEDLTINVEEVFENVD